MVEGKPLPAIWDVPDDLWARIDPVILQLDPPKARGRKRTDQRKMLEGIIFRMRSGCQWNHWPKELGDDSTIHRTFQRWVGCGVLAGIWAALIEECQELGGVDWEWQSADCSMGKARLGGAIGRNPTDRGKAGSKKSILVDAAGGPLSVVVAGANVHDTKLLRPTLESIVVERPEGTQNRCLDPVPGQGVRQSHRPRDRRRRRIPASHPAYWCREIGPIGYENPPSPAVGGGTHPGLAVQVPGDPGALRQEAIQLPGSASTGWCTYLVPPSMEPR